MLEKARAPLGGDLPIMFEHAILRRCIDSTCFFRCRPDDRRAGSACGLSRRFLLSLFDSKYLSRSELSALPSPIWTGSQRFL